MENTPNINEMNDLREKISRASEVTGLAPTPLAKAAGLAHATLTRFINQPGMYNLSNTSMKKIDAAVNRIVNAESKTPEEAAKKLAYYHNGNQTNLAPVNINAINIQIHGVVQAGHWTEAVELPPHEREIITIPRPNGYSTYFGLTVKGLSMNQEYPEGTTLICVPLWDYGPEPTSGDHVIIHRHDGEGMTEATVKELQKSSDGRCWLVPRSTEPEFQPIEIQPEQLRPVDTGIRPDVQITAVVVADFRIRNRRG